MHARINRRKQHISNAKMFYNYQNACFIVSFSGIERGATKLHLFAFLMMNFVLEARNPRQVDNNLRVLQKALSAFLITAGFQGALIGELIILSCKEIFSFNLLCKFCIRFDLVVDHLEHRIESRIILFDAYFSSTTRRTK